MWAGRNALWHISSAHLEPFSARNIMQLHQNCSTSFPWKKSEFFFGLSRKQVDRMPIVMTIDVTMSFGRLEGLDSQPWVKDPTKVLQRFTTCPEFTKTTTHLTVWGPSNRITLNTKQQCTGKDSEKKIYIYIYTSIFKWAGQLYWLTKDCISLFMLQNNQMSTFASLFSVLWIYPVPLFF